MKPPPLVKSLQLRLKGVSPSERLASLIVLASELSHLHKVHGYQVKGRRMGGEAKRPTWEKFCAANAGITDRTAKSYLECADMLKFRLNYDPRPEAKNLLQLMKQRPSDLTENERRFMIEGIETLGLRPEDSHDSLRREYRMPRAPMGETGMQAASSCDNAAQIEALALACGVSEKTAKRVALIVRAQIFKNQVARLYLSQQADDADKHRSNGHHQS